MSEATRIVEVGGIKVEIDLRDAKVIENYRVGDTVKILIKKYQDTYETYPGVIVGFDAFENRPTIIVAYVETSYSSAEVKMAYIHKDSKDTEIIPASSNEFLLSEKSRIKDFLDQAILQAEQLLEEKKAAKAYFLKYFGLLFKDIAE